MPLTIMLAVHCKKSEPADLKPALVEYVRGSYGQQVGLWEVHVAGACGRCMCVGEWVAAVRFSLACVQHRTVAGWCRSSQCGALGGEPSVRVSSR